MFAEVQISGFGSIWNRKICKMLGEVAHAFSLSTRETGRRISEFQGSQSYTGEILTFFFLKEEEEKEKKEKKEGKERRKRRKGKSRKRRRRKRREPVFPL